MSIQTTAIAPDPVLFVRDALNIFYPAAPGLVYRIAIDDLLLDATGADDYFATHTEATDAIGLCCDDHPGAPDLRTLYPLGFNVGDPDHQDLIEMWAVWCDEDAERRAAA